MARSIWRRRRRAMCHEHETARRTAVGDPDGIRVKAIAIVRRNGEVLLSFAIDPDTGSRYGRLLGGGVEPGERAHDAIRREWREELGVDLRDVVSLGVVENIYEHGGRTQHEVIVVFAAAFADPALYEVESFPVREAVCDGPAEWVGIDRLERNEIPIYPPELLQLLADVFGRPTPAPRRPSNQA